MSKFPRILVCLLLCCTIFCGCSAMPDSLEPIVVNEMDLTISLPGYFENMVQNETAAQIEGFFMYGYNEIIITGVRDKYELFDTVPTLEEYANGLIENSQVLSQVEIVDGLTTFTYRQLDNMESYTYISAVFAGTDAFWMVSAGCKTINFDSARDKFVEILKTTQVA